MKKTFLTALLAVSTFSIGYLMAQSSSSILDESLAQIRKDVASYPKEKRSVYVRGLREGIDTCIFMLPKGQAEELSKNPKLRDFLDFLDKN
ncbi:MAG: hypothetical protein PSU94_12065 [Lacunisphaera sp.]|nr:hypothetical protein [Lacunisphaera sp.]